MPTIRRILHPTDFSAASDAAFRNDTHPVLGVADPARAVHVPVGPRTLTGTPHRAGAPRGVVVFARGGAVNHFPREGDR